MRRFKYGKYYLTGTQAPDWMHIILFNEPSGTNKGSGFENWMQWATPTLWYDSPIFLISKMGSTGFQE